MTQKMEIVYGLLILAVACLLLVIADRVIRISPLLEPFSNAQRCGVDMEPCPHPLQCMNGYCMPTSTPRISPVTDLPVLP